MRTESKYKIGLIIIVSIIYLIAIFSSEYYVADWFSTDDAFYYFKTADNIIKGLGSTFDGISKTNGYHPLWMIILIPLFLFSKIGLFLPLRLIIVVQLGLALLTIIVLFDFLRSQIPIYLSALISLMWVLLKPIFEVATNGTESILNGFSLTLFWVMFSKFLLSSDRNKYQSKKVGLLGIAAVLAVFSRLDNVFFITIFGIWLGLSYLLGQKRKFSLEHIKDLLIIELSYFLPITLLLSLYLVWNKLTIGSLMPLSGQVKKFWGELPMTVYGSRVNGIGEFLAEMFSRDQGPWNLFFAPFYKLVDSFTVSYLHGTRTVSLGLILIPVMAFILGFIISKKWAIAKKRIVEWSIIPLFLATLVHFSYYKVFGYLASRDWYWVGGSFLIIMIIAVVLENVILAIADIKVINTHFLSVLIVFVIGILIIKPHLGSSLSRLTNRSDPTHYYLQKSAWLEQRTGPQSIIGMTGAGTTAYFIKDRVIMNLDGLVNSEEYFNDLKDGTVDRFLEQNEVAYVFGNQYIMLETDPYRENYLQLLEQSDRIDEFAGDLILWKLVYSD